MSLIEDQGYITRDCPNCGNYRNDFKKKVKSARPLETMKWNEAKEFFVGFRFRQPFFTYIECGKCSLLYCPTYFNQKQLDELYGSMPDNLAGENEEIVGKTQRNYIKYLPRRNEDVSLLEIGSDIGLVTGEILRRFNTSKVVAIEPNKDVHERFLSNLKQFDAKITIYEDINEIENSDKLNTIVGIHVFDHIIEPITYIKKLTSLMRPGSQILIIVHNENSLLRKILGKKWPPFCPQHPHLFSPKTIAKILKSLDFVDIKVHKTTNWFSVRHVIKLMGTIFGLKIEAKLFDYINLPLKLGNMAIVAEIKK
jgi:hypothetical protein